MIVAIDGPAGSGKGTVTKEIAKRMGLINLDTGATYRCVALASLKHGIKLEEEDKIVSLIDDLDIEFKYDKDDFIRVYLNGEEVTSEIRSFEVNQIVSPISSIVRVRLKMVDLQRKMAEGKDVIMEGRDIGTYVFPNADVKIYLDASEEVRAKRRYEENVQNGINTTYEEVLENVKMRDYNDMHKKVGALKKANDAIVIDSTSLTIDQVVENIKKLLI